MSTVGSRIGSPATRRSLERSATPSTMGQTSVDVPPMSNAIAFGKPASDAMRAAPTAPAAGPDTSTSAGCAAASSTFATPPDERITSGSGSPPPTAALASARR
jgi:hypothetical protein